MVMMTYRPVAGRFDVGASSCRRKRIGRRAGRARDELRMDGGGRRPLVENQEGDRDDLVRWLFRPVARNATELNKIEQMGVRDVQGFSIFKISVLAMVKLLYGLFAIGTPGCRIFWYCPELSLACRFPA